MSPENSGQDPRVYLAAERTFLAWIRTGLALMGFGFVVVRFGLFLRELAASHGIAQTDPSAVSHVGNRVGVAGRIRQYFCGRGPLRYVGALKQGSLVPSKPSTLGIVLAIALAIAGLILAFYLGARTDPYVPANMIEHHVP